MSRIRVAFDTEALIALYLGEEGGLKTKTYLERIQRGEIDGLFNIIKLSELYYILYRKSPRVAVEKEANLLSYGVKIVEIPYDELWREAAKIKATRAISLADAFAAATARLEKAALLTGRDEEFKGLGLELVRIK